MKGNIIYKKTIPARSPEYAEFPKSLHPDIQDFLSGQNIKSLYTHQAEAFSHAMTGENIVITTPTASGKSLCFYLPVVQEILKDPVTRAIFIYPTKALAADQYRALIPWMEALGEHRLSVGVYDGDTLMRHRPTLESDYTCAYLRFNVPAGEKLTVRTASSFTANMDSTLFFPI